MESPANVALEQSAEWQAGYAAALGDAISVIDALRGPSQTNLSAPILLRIRTRVLDLCSSRKTTAA